MIEAVISTVCRKVFVLHFNFYILILMFMFNFSFFIFVFSVSNLFVIRLLEIEEVFVQYLLEPIML